MTSGAMTGEIGNYTIKSGPYIIRHFLGITLDKSYTLSFTMIYIPVSPIFVVPYSISKSILALLLQPSTSSFNSTASEKTQM